MENLSDGQLGKILYALTIRDRGGDREKWLRRGIPKLEKISPDGMLGYWRRRIDSNTDAMALALTVWSEYQTHLQDLASGRLDRPEESLQSMQTPKPPSLLKMVGNLVKATVAESKAVILKEPPVSEVEYQRRLKLCGTCDLFEKGTGRCMSCGCFMTYKAKMRSQQCPTGKWGPVR